MAMFGAFDVADMSASWTAIEPALVALIQSRSPISARLAGRYLAEFRAAEGVGGAASVRLASTPVVDDLIPNLRFVGIANARRLDDLKRAPSEIARVTLSNVEGEVTRHVLNGGRSTIVETVRGDSRARGYTRVTDGAPCAFCAMLAGRGPVYNSDTSGSFDAHRKCGCTAEPVYFTDAPWSPSAKRWDDLYRAAAKAVPKDSPDFSTEVRREFRRRYEATTT